MKKALLFTFGLSVVLMTGVSCKKNCNIPEEDSFSGPIINTSGENNVVIYPQTGSLLLSFPNGMIVNSASTQGEQDLFQVSFDGGLTRQAIDYSQYSVIGYPLDVKCDASVDRSLSPNFVSGTALYRMTVQECSDCDEVRTLENWILVPDSITTNYTVTFDVVQ